jgi:hypothetical protein
MPDYRSSIFYAPVLKNLAPKWRRQRQIARGGIAIGVIGVFVGLYLASALTIGIVLLLALPLFVFLNITASRYLAAHIPAALAITERLSKECFDLNIHGPQAKRELEIEISRLRAIELDKLHPPSEPISVEGGTMLGARGEELF